MLALLLAVSVCAAPAAGQPPQGTSPPYRLIAEGAWGNLQKAVDGAAADGYAVLVGRPLNSFLILQRITEPAPAAAYKFVGGKKDVERELTRGYRFVPGTLDVSETGAPVLIAAKTSDTAAREVLAVEATRGSTLDNKILEARKKGFRVLGLASGPGGHVAVLERVTDAPPAPDGIDEKAYIAVKGRDNVQKALAESAAAGYRIEQGGAFNEMRLVLERHEGEPSFEYRVLAATRHETLLEQMNAASADGFTVTPGTLQAVQIGSVLGMQRLGSEYMVIMERTQGQGQGPEYFIADARRRSTLAGKFDDAVAAGYAPVAAVIGFQEQDTLVLFARPRR
jgi:hypothetical protein